MPELVDLDDAEHAHDVHHGGVELQAVVRRAHMVADTEEALGHQGRPHGVENAQLLQNSRFRSENEINSTYLFVLRFAFRTNKIHP